jgi:hypothetical protein
MKIRSAWIMPARTRLAKPSMVSGKRDNSPADPNHHQAGSVRCPDSVEEQTCNDRADDPQREIYCHADAGAIEELTTEGASGNSKQDEDND